MQNVSTMNNKESKNALPTRTPQRKLTCMSLLMDANNATDTS